jgi:acetyltransferase-like isoleucine patch superfamily enzyme
MKKIATRLLRVLPIKLQCLILSTFLKGRIYLGFGSFIHYSVHILGRDNVRVGSNSCLSEGSWLNVNHRRGNKIAIAIGNNCFIGKQNFFSSGDAILIGDYTLTAIGCKFIGSSHNVNNPEIPYLLSGTTSDDRIQIGANCFFGAGSTVMGNVKIGHGSVIGAESLVLKDIPPFSMAVGNPAQVVKRYSFSNEAWLPISEISSKDEADMPNEMEYLVKLKSNFSHINLPWIAAGRSMGDL